MTNSRAEKLNKTELATDSIESLKLENQICFPLYSASNAIVRAYRPYLNELDLTYLQYMVLMVLWEENKLNVKELGQRLKLDSGTLTPLLKRLALKGLVERTRSDKDERSRIISITSEGQKLHKKAESIPEKLSCKVGLEKQQLVQLRLLCQQVLSALDNNH
jgi:DNA-binding MarR family transcriptional regulator